MDGIAKIAGKDGLSEVGLAPCWEPEMWGEGRPWTLSQFEFWGCRLFISSICFHFYP